jgi:hypothetical protein
LATTFFSSGSSADDGRVIACSSRSGWIGASIGRRPCIQTAGPEFCDRHGIGAIDVLKSDAQGCDLDVLLGAERMISAKRVPFVFVELGFQPDDIINPPFAPLNEHLTAHGYRLSGFYEQSGWGRNAALIFCNALYFHPDALRQRFSCPG